ncbi:MAG: SAM-dependent chlorinase/fluorinase [Methylohalobius sp.]|nr:SAM-dependent chlorinase/fluorinase [Methylohalobius sp.]
MLVTFTDFGPFGPYLGQVLAVLKQRAPGIEVIDLVNNAPPADPVRSGYLLAALADWWPEGTVFLSVVDPGVGTSRLSVALWADGKWFVGPDNGLLYTVAVHSQRREWYRIVWQPKELSASFHGRDLFAPVAAWLATGRREEVLEPWTGPDLAAWPRDLPEIVYLDVYGNAVTGLRFCPERIGCKLRCGDRTFAYARTFGEAAPGEAFWYGNSMGLVEIAVNGGSAAGRLGLTIGQKVDWT